jgi:hypothetical protein
VALAIVLGATGVALARPGGGESYSGGGGHGGGGGGDAGLVFELIYWTLRLCLYYPYVGLPILALIVGWVIRSAYRQHQNKDWDSGPPVELEGAIDLSELRRVDPDFSQVVFEDFAFRLFSTAHRARSTATTLATIAPYVSAAARTALAEREPRGEPVVQVIVGAMRVVRLDALPAPRATPSAPGADAAPARTRVEIAFEANVATATHTYFSVESWLFGRDAGRTSKPPGVSRTFPCPNCGAPWQASATGTQQCASCNEIVDNGRFDWVVEAISLASIDERPPTLTTEVPERGTELDTYRQPAVDAQLEQLNADDPAVTEAALVARLHMIYDRLAKAWSNNEVAPMRGLVSDGLYDYLAYWVDAYKRQGLRNQLTDLRITRTEVAKLIRDRWYDAITIRLWGTGKDFVVRSTTGEVVRGSKHRERPYSEYWTLIRSAQRKGPPKPTAACGNCGAPLAITQAGACEHCGSHVTAGEFDWVLSKIEQDDSYRG